MLFNFKSPDKSPKSLLVEPQTSPAYPAYPAYRQADIWGAMGVKIGGAKLIFLEEPPFRISKSHLYNLVLQALCFSCSNNRIRHQKALI